MRSSETQLNALEAITPRHELHITKIQGGCNLMNARHRSRCGDNYHVVVEIAFLLTVKLTFGASLHNYNVSLGFPFHATYKRHISTCTETTSSSTFSLWRILCAGQNRHIYSSECLNRLYLTVVHTEYNLTNKCIFCDEIAIRIRWKS